MGVSPQRLVSRLPPIPHGPRVVAPALPVHGQLRCDLVCPCTIACFQACGDTLVQALPLHRGNAVVEHLAIEGMGEPVPGCDRAVRPDVTALAAQEVPASRHALTPLLDLCDVCGESSGHCCGREHQPRHAAGCEHALCLVVKLRQLPFNELA